MIGRRPFVAEAIIEHLRKEGAIASSNGIETSTHKIRKTLNLSHTAVATNLMRLLDSGIVVVKHGVHEQGNREPKSLALAEGYEQGDEWKSIFFIKGDPSVSSPKKPAKLATLGGNTSLIDQLLQAKLQINELQKKVMELQQKVIDVQVERNKAYEDFHQLESRMKEVEEDSRLNSEEARKGQQELANLELQLREAMSKANQYDRQIAKNDERARVFAHR